MRYKFPLILVYTADSTISGYDSVIDYLIKAIFLNNRLWPNTSKFIISLLFFFLSLSQSGTKEVYTIADSERKRVSQVQ